jgi:simple sugar transport system ATP-binding protein
MRTVSGGNQQKLVLARELGADGGAGTGPRAIVAENPTRGLDVRAAAEIHGRLRRERDAGAAVVVYSSDIDELLQLSTRILVVHAGVVRETAVDRESVGRLMLGAETDGSS